MVLCTRVLLLILKTSRKNPRPWFLLANSQTQLIQALKARLPGERTGFILGLDSEQDSPFPIPQAARDSVDEWVKKLDGLEPVFYSLPIIYAGASGGASTSIPRIAAAVAEAGVQALVIDSHQYADFPEFRDAAEGLAGFPSGLGPQDQSLRTYRGK